MGTNLQVLYDRFQSKVDEDMYGKESLIFALVDSAISKSYKDVHHSLKYTLTDAPVYEGEFNEVLDGDEIELLALWMKYEWDGREQQKLLKLRDDIGTSDFNRLPNKMEKVKTITATMKAIREEINDLKDSMNTYKY